MTAGIIGLLIGSFVAFRYEKSKGTIYSVGEMQSLSGLPLIAELLIKNNDGWGDTLYLIINNLISETKGQIAILVNYEIDESIVTKIEKNLQEFISKEQIIFTSDIKKTDTCIKSIFLTSLGMTSKKSLINIKDRILFKEDKLIGTIVFNNL